MTVDWELLVDFGLVVLIWMVQAIVYPGFRHLDETVFSEVHKTYERVISVFVVPLMTAQLVLKGINAIQHPGGITIVALSVVLLCWCATFFLAVPCHRELEKRGKDLAVVNRLVRFNWIRTFGWTAVFALRFLGHS